MKTCKKLLAMLAALALTAGMLSGCGLRPSFGIGSFVTGESYPNGAAYQTGAFTYQAEDVQSVEIYWRCGRVELVESDKAELSVRESGGELPEDAAMHYLLEDGTLKIRFCASNVRLRVHSNDKHLTVEVPRGVDLSVHTTSAAVKADTLEQNSILISAHSGSIRAGSLSAGTLKGNTSSGSVRIDDLEADAAGLETSSGGVDLGLSAVSQLNVHTSSGRTVLRLAEGGGTVVYTAGSGKLRTERVFEQRGDLYVFGGGESRITVDSSSGNLQIR